MEAKITKLDVEVMVNPPPSARITKLDIEVMVCPDPARVTKLDIEIMVDPNATPETNTNIDGDAVISLENFGSEINLFSENTILDGYIESDEDIDIITLDSQNEIFPSSITSQETFKKQKMYPTPYYGTSYIWIEKPLTIETDLNFRKKS